jgi:hypothetical protein
MAIGLLFSSAIGLSDWRIQETINLSDQALNLSDYRTSDSELTIDCTPLLK